MKSKTDILQDIVRKYQKAGHELPASPKDIARWAIQSGLWKPKPEEIVTKCADQIARAMAAEYFTDSHGRRVRAKHAVVYPVGPEQHVLWDDIRTAEHKHIEVALQQRRNHILGECKQLKNDVDYYNEGRRPPKQLVIIFNFELDLEEMDLARRKKSA